MTTVGHLFSDPSTSHDSPAKNSQFDADKFSGAAGVRFNGPRHDAFKCGLVEVILVRIRPALARLASCLFCGEGHQ